MGRVLTAKRTIGWVGFIGLVTAATVTACAGKALDVGADGPVGGGSSAAGGKGGGTGVGAPGNLTYQGPSVAGAEWPDPAACLPAPDSPIVGTYKGNWPLSDGFDELKGDAVLTIRGATADGLPCGTLRIGQGDPPPPATDPDTQYPEGQGVGGGLGGIGIGRSTAYPGADYQIYGVSNSSTRLAFSIAYNELLRSWCGLQTRYPGSNSCLPTNYSGSQDQSGCTITPTGEGPIVIPCFKLSYCSPHVCVCSEAACDAVPQGTFFELHWDDGNLEGAVNGGTPIFLDRTR